jgi:uncharacterized protein YndB with AHSA1/START domain
MPIDPSPFALERGRAMTGSPLSLARATRLGAPPEEIFAFITDFPRLPEWMPLIKRCTVDNSQAQAPGRVGAVRVIEAPMAKPTRETVMAFEAPRLLAYSASDASLMGMFTGHLGVLTCEPHPQGGTWFTWLSFGHRGGAPMGWFGPPMFNFVVGRSISSLERRFHTSGVSPVTVP